MGEHVLYSPPKQLSSLETVEYLKNELHMLSEEQVRTLLQWLSTVPCYTTYRVNTLITTPEQIVEKLSCVIKKQAVMRKMKVPYPIVTIHPSLPDVVVLGYWNCKSLDLTPRQQEVIVDKFCGAAVLRGAHVFAPGVMGMPAGVQNGDRVSVYADVANQCKQGLQHVYTGPKVFVGNGIARMGRKQLYYKGFAKKGIAVEMTDVTSGCCILEPGCVLPSQALLQNLPSIVCGRVLDPQPNDAVLDMCAAPGNKTTHLAMLVKDEGFIIALDKTKSKVKNILSRCKQFFVHCVYAFVCDSTTCVMETDAEGNLQHEGNNETDSQTTFFKTEHTQLERNEDNAMTTSGTDRNLNVLLNGPPFPPGCFDKILLDAPCSALGQRPQMVNDISVKQLKSYPPLQHKLFETAVMLLKQGGCLVYSTCTITVAENEGLVSWALTTFPCLRLKPVVPVIGGPGLQGVGLTEEQRHCVQRFGPVMSEPVVTLDYDKDTVGFFIACFVKI